MSETPQANRECIHCGTERPVDEELCPSCGKPWIDGRVDEVSAAAAPSASDTAAPDTQADAGSDTPAEASAAGAATGAATGAAKLDDTGEFTFDDWTLPPEKPKNKTVWLIPVLLLVAAIAVWTLVFLDDDGTTVTTSASPTTTAVATPTDPTTTTSPDTTTTTTAAPTTTVVVYPPPESWESVGEPIDTADLTLKAAGIGPLEFGLTIEEAAGRLTASLGEAEAAGIEGLCPPEESYYLQWGELEAIFDGFEPDSLFVSYRYEDAGSDTELGLATLSGLQLGDTVAELKQIYSSFTIAFEVIEGQDHFRLLDGGELLLWGPVTSDDDSGLILGIYSPTACDTGT